MRDLLAVASVILLALGLGGAAAYLSSEVTPAAFEWAREAPVISTITSTFNPTPRPVKPVGGACKYCADVAELGETFARRAEAARRHAEALQDAMRESADGQTAKTPATVAELKTARQAATRAEAAAAVLREWSSRCSSEDFCRAPAKPQLTKAAACASEGDKHAAAAALIAAAVKQSAQACATASCPAVDCGKTASLRSDIAAVGASLVSLSGPVKMAPGQAPPTQLPVGASTVESELSRVVGEAGYVIKMFPLLLDKTSAAKSPSMQLPKLAPEMVNERAEVVAQLASVMVQSSTIAPASRDVRPEAAWRLRSLAVNLAALGQEAERATGPRAAAEANWERLAQSLGGSLLDLARIEAMLERMRGEAPVPGRGCDGSVADTAQQVREALAMLDLCRMRSACARGTDGRRDVFSTASGLNSTNAKDVQSAARAALDALLPRAQEAVANMTVNDVGGGETALQVSNGGEPKLITVLRSQGVCRRAQDIREAAAVAPEAARNVAEALTPPASEAPLVALTPQTVVAGAADTVTQAATSTQQVASPFAPVTPAAELAQTMARFIDASPRHKPMEMLTASEQPVPTAAGAYRGVLVPPSDPDAGLSYIGGPQQFGQPADDTPAPSPVSAPALAATPKQ